MQIKKGDAFIFKLILVFLVIDFFLFIPQCMAHGDKEM